MKDCAHNKINVTQKQNFFLGMVVSIVEKGENAVCHNVIEIVLKTALNTIIINKFKPLQGNDNF